MVSFSLNLQIAERAHSSHGDAAELPIGIERCTNSGTICRWSGNGPFPFSSFD